MPASKFSPEVQARVCAALERAVPRDKAALIGNISPRCFHDWMRRGIAGDERYVAFADAVKAAEARCVERQLERIEAAAESGSWQASAWILERRWHKDFGRKDNMRATIAYDDKAKKLTDEELRAELLKAAQAIVAKGAA